MDLNPVAHYTSINDYFSTSVLHRPLRVNRMLKSNKGMVLDTFPSPLTCDDVLKRRPPRDHRQNVFNVGHHDLEEEHHN